MSDDPLYREEILEHYRSSRHRGRIDHPDFAAELDNPLCGDQIRLELAVDQSDRIAQARFDGHGCAISQAAASLLAEQLEGQPLASARRFTSEQMLQLLGIHLTPARRKCGLLAWRALHQALASDSTPR
jgi:nitrogen fixation NifU-like protein